MENIKKVLSPAALDVLSLYYENSDFIDNISEITRLIGAAFPTTRKAIDALAGAGILTELDIGKSRIFRLNKESKVVTRIFELFDELKEKKLSG